VDDQKNVLERTLAGTFQCRMQLTQQREIVMTGHVYSDDTKEEINARIDLHQDAMDRQFIRCDLTNKQAQRENMIQQLELHRQQLEELRAMQGDGAGKVKLTSQQRQILQTGEASVRQAVKNIEMLDSLIAAAQKKLGMEA
jgi:hypothetical protein